MADERTAERHMETLRRFSSDNFAAYSNERASVQWLLSQLAAKDAEIERLRKLPPDTPEGQCFDAQVTGGKPCDVCSSCLLEAAIEKLNGQADEIARLGQQVARLTEERDIEARSRKEMAERVAALDKTLAEQNAVVVRQDDEVMRLARDNARLLDQGAEAALYLTPNVEDRPERREHKADLLARLRAALHPMNPSNPKEPTCPQP